MANEPRHQQQQPQPPKPAPQVEAERKTAPPSPYNSGQSGIDYLFSKGWKCLGDPTWPTAHWYDPTKPEVYTTRQEPKFGWVREQIPGEFGKDGAPVVRPVYKQLYCQDGSGTPNKVVPIVQTVVSFPAEPVPMQVALRIQLDRDAVERREQMLRQQQREPVPA